MAYIPLCVCVCVCVCVCLCVYTTCSFSSVWHLGFFYILAIVNKTPANTVVHVSFQISVLICFVQSFPCDSVGDELPVMKEMQIQSLGQGDPLEEGMAIHFSILAWRILDRGAWWATVHGITKSRTRLSN